MIIPPKPDNEKERLQALNEYSILDTEAEKVYDEIVSLASFICDTPISTITLIDENRQWFKARIGIDDPETPRDVAFCAHAINHDDMLVVKDAALDERFHDNPFVLRKPDIRFYAGMPLTTSSGFKLGTLCVIDTKPKELTEKQNTALRILSHQVMKLLELRKRNGELQKLHAMHNRLLSIIGHDLRSPLSSIDGLLLLAENYELTVEEYKDLVPRMRQMVDTTNNLLLNLLHWAKSHFEGKIIHKEGLIIKAVSHNTIEDNAHLFQIKKNVVNNDIQANHFVRADKNMTEFILRNLILNANKFMSGGLITLSSKAIDDKIEICVSDNGPGIEKEILKDIFSWGERKRADGTNHEKGSGLGLPMCKEFTERQGGTMRVTTAIGKGTSFYFTLTREQ